MKKYFGTDGIRGKAFEVLNSRLAFKLGQAIAKKYNPKEVVIGEDTRLSSNMLSYGVAYGLATAEEKIKKAEKSSVFGEIIRNVELCKKNYEKAKIDFEESKENLNFVSKKYDEIFQQENDFAVLKAETKKMQSEFSVLEEQLNEWEMND